MIKLDLTDTQPPVNAYVQSQLDSDLVNDEIALHGFIQGFLTIKTPYARYRINLVLSLPDPPPAVFDQN